MGAVQLILIDKLKEIVYFPVWWYSRGFFEMIKIVLGSIADFNFRLGVGIWVKNIFNPMFGQRDFAGRVVSFFMRLVQIIGRGIGLLVIALVHVFFIVVWVVMPLIILYEIFYFLS